MSAPLFFSFSHFPAQAPRPDRSAEQHLLEAFKVFDRQEDGLISEGELKTIFSTLGEAMDLDSINHILAEVKIDSNGKIRYADLIKHILK